MQESYGIVHLPPPSQGGVIMILDTRTNINAVNKQNRKWQIYSLLKCKIIS